MRSNGYRICWLGKRKKRMRDILQDNDNNLGDYYYLAYPGTEKNHLKEIRASFFILSSEGLDGYRKPLMRWISAYREITPQGRVLMLAPNSSDRYLSDALIHGADWVLPFTENDDDLKFYIRSIILQHKAERSILRARHKARKGYLFEGMIGNTAIMKDLCCMLRKCAPSQANVIIRGESGTGKELVAKAIHRLSGRKGRLVNVNCAALMDSLHQSEFFGHEKGAFTDAKIQRLGYFEAAEGGTLFLDEIGDMSAIAQIALLRVIEGKEFFRVGGSDPVQVDVRIVAATNRNLEEKVEQGLFREDLYYRLNGFSLTVPPLRERKEDIPLLADYFIQHFAQREQKQVLGFTPEALDLLACYNWPGNVREMENEIQKTVIHAEGERLISSEMLSPSINIFERFVPYNSVGQTPLKLQMQQLEAFYIKEALKKNYGNRTRTAKILGISREGLHKKISRYKID